MKYLGVCFDRSDVCLPESLTNEIYNVAERIRVQTIRDLTATCLKLDIDTRRYVRIMLDDNEDGLKLYISIPEPK